MGITALSLLFTLLVLNIHHHNPKKPVPKVIQLMVLNWLAKAVCMKRKENNNSEKPKSLGANQLKPEHIDGENNIGAKAAYPGVNESLPADVLMYIRKKIQDDVEADEIENNREDWHHAASIVDRFLLILFSLAIFIMSVTCLLLIIDGNT